MAKPIHLTQHARRQMEARKATPEEVEAAIRSSPWKQSEGGRYMAAKVFPFRQQHFGRFYPAKEVVPIFVEETDRIVVITVYTFFSQREVET
ncbi:DUF4258 domain-containing protein [Acidobacteriia bacterium AH_259_A11_L15]|nr:DUF4258 domain-containing protein [Acidobacteriia bacterium AH_259_A11_L15]